MIESNPLCWPVGRARTPEGKRKRALFHRRVEGGKYSTGQVWTKKAETTLYQGIVLVREELGRLRASDVVISTDVPVRKDGLPYSSAREPKDPGAAVYFRLAGGVHCLACDRWDRVADNLHAIGHHIEAMRAQDRWGVGNLAQAFAGYKALPAMDAGKTWWALLGFTDPPKSREVVEERYRKQIYAAHPDRGGSANVAAEINAAFTEAEKFYAGDGR